MASVYDELRELEELLRLTWPERCAALEASGVPLMLGDDDDDDDGDDDGDDDDERVTATGGDDDDDGGDDDDSDDDDDAPRPKKPERNWKSSSRRHERAHKRVRAELEDLQKRYDELISRGKSDQDKAIEKAKREAVAEAEAKHLADRREDRLESTVTRLAGQAMKIGEGDDARSVKFADPEDALIRINRAIRKGELDADDIFEKGGVKIDESVLTEYMEELLDSKPHLGVSVQEKTGKKRPPKGANDAGKGKGGTKDMEDMTFEDHLARVQKRR